MRSETQHPETNEDMWRKDRGGSFPCKETAKNCVNGNQRNKQHLQFTLRFIVIAPARKFIDPFFVVELRVRCVSFVHNAYFIVAGNGNGKLNGSSAVGLFKHANVLPIHLTNCSWDYDTRKFYDDIHWWFYAYFVIVSNRKMLLKPV